MDGWRRILLWPAPVEGGGGQAEGGDEILPEAGDGTPVQQAEPVAPAPPAESSVSPQPPTPSPQPQPASLVERMRALGVPLPAQVTSDDQATLALAQAYQRAGQADWYSQVGQAVAPELEEFRRWQAERQQQARQVEAQKRGWNPPEFQESWLQAVEVGEDGQVRAKPGHDPAMARKVAEYQAYTSDWWASTRRDPARQYQMPEFQQAVERVVQERLQQYQQQQVSEQILQRNAPWLYAWSGEGQDAQPVLNAQGRPQFSVAGQLYAQALQEYGQHVARHGGSIDPLLADRWARETAFGRLAYQQLQQLQGSPGTQTPAQQQASRQAARTPARNTGQVQRALQGGGEPVSPRSERGLDIDEMLRKAFDENGIPDQIDVTQH